MNLLTATLWLATLAEPQAAVTGLQVLPAGGQTEIVIAVDGPVATRDFLLTDPVRLVVDLSGARHALPAERFAVGRGGVRAVRTSQFQPNVVRVVVELDAPVRYTVIRADGAIRIAFPNPGGAFTAWSVGTARTGTEPAWTDRNASAGTGTGPARTGPQPVTGADPARTAQADDETPGPATTAPAAFPAPPAAAAPSARAAPAAQHLGVQQLGREQVFHAHQPRGEALLVDVLRQRLDGVAVARHAIRVDARSRQGGLPSACLRCFIHNRLLGTWGCGTLQGTIALATKALALGGLTHLSWDDRSLGDDLAIWSAGAYLWLQWVTAQQGIHRFGNIMMHGNAIAGLNFDEHVKSRG